MHFRAVELGECVADRAVLVEVGQRKRELSGAGERLGAIFVGRKIGLPIKADAAGLQILDRAAEGLDVVQRAGEGGIVTGFCRREGRVVIADLDTPIHLVWRDLDRRRADDGDFVSGRVRSRRRWWAAAARIEEKG